MILLTLFVLLICSLTSCEEVFADLVSCGSGLPCICHWASGTIDCKNAQITESSLELIPLNVSTLVLDGNKFRSFNISSFSKFTKLTKLSIQNSSISSIDLPAAYSTLPILETLDLGYNNITEVSAGAFLPRTLKSLKLNDNKISSISSDALSAMVISSISNLDISNNKLNKLPAFPGQLQSFLLNVNLSGNNLGEYLDNISMSENLFHRFKQVRSLDLSRNNISELHPWLLADMTSLMYLYLSGNVIKDLDQISIRRDEHQIVTFNHWGQDSPIFWFPHGLFALRHIDLSHNNISKLDVKIFTLDNLPSLNTIDLSFNNFTCDAEMYMFFEAYLYIQNKTAWCHRNKSEQCIQFPKNSFPKNFSIVNISVRDANSGYYCKYPSSVKGVHVLDFQCTGTCQQEYFKSLPHYQNWKAIEELIHTDTALSSGFTIAITLAVLTVITLSLLVICYKLDLWRRITGQMRYVQVRRNLLQLEGGDDAVI